MHKKIFFISEEDINDNTAVIKGSDVNHIKNVLRLKIGHFITGKTYDRRELDLKIIKFLQDRVVCSILQEKKINIHNKSQAGLVLSFPRPAVLQSLIPKLTEIDCVFLQLIITERSFIKNASRFNHQRFEKISQESMKQCGRHDPMAIMPVLSLTEFIHKNNLQQYSDYLKLFPYEGEKITKIKTIINKENNSKAIFVIGPEGGFSQDEAGQIIAAGFNPICLTNNILKVETAALFSMISFIYEKEF